MRCPVRDIHPVGAGKAERPTSVTRKREFNTDTGASTGAWNGHMHRNEESSGHQGLNRATEHHLEKMRKVLEKGDSDVTQQPEGTRCHGSAYLKTAGMHICVTCSFFNNKTLPRA